MRELGLVRHGAVLIRDGCVAAVGSRPEVNKTAAGRAAVRMDAAGKVVMPGFVDSHTHALFVGTRVDEYVARIEGMTYEDIARAGGGIQASAKRMRAARVPDLIEHVNGVLKKCIEYGTTTVEIKSGYGLEVAVELKMLKAIQGASKHQAEVVATLLLHDVPAHLRGQRARYLGEVVHRLIPAAAKKGMAEFCDVFCDRGYFSTREAEHILLAASANGLKPKLHAEQLAHSGGARLAVAVGAVSADHLDRVTAADIRAMARSNTIGTLLPGTVLHLGGTYPPARRLIDHGVPVALATNFNPGSSPTLNMQLILSLACSQMGMTPAESVVAATVNGAYAVGRGRRLGTLEVGKQADLVIMDVEDYREIPYFFGLNHCATVVKKGRVMFSRGHA
jgi:imidazolonepropionase